MDRDVIVVQTWSVGKPCLEASGNSIMHMAIHHLTITVRVRIDVEGIV